MLWYNKRRKVHSFVILLLAMKKYSSTFIASKAASFDVLLGSTIVALIAVLTTKLTNGISSTWVASLAAGERPKLVHELLPTVHSVPWSSLGAIGIRKG